MLVCTRTDHAMKTEVVIQTLCFPRLPYRLSRCRESTKLNKITKIKGVEAIVKASCKRHPKHCNQWQFIVQHPIRKQFWKQKYPVTVTVKDLPNCGSDAKLYQNRTRSTTNRTLQTEQRTTDSVQTWFRL